MGLSSWGPPIIFQSVGPLGCLRHACLQLLGELAGMCGPFESTLRKLQDALLPSIYSCCSGPSMAGPRALQFDMLPWFALAGKLRRQNNTLLEQQAAFSLELAQHQVRLSLGPHTLPADLQAQQGPCNRGTFQTSL